MDQQKLSADLYNSGDRRHVAVVRQEQQVVAGGASAALDGACT